jgi:SAM-dependent methyltransferase
MSTARFEHVIEADPYLGVVILVRVKDGVLVPGWKIRLMATGAVHAIDRVGVFTPKGVAVEAWDERWATPEGRDNWLVPHPAVAALVPVLKARGTQHGLDLGCGVGWHALLFAEHGFAVEAIDGAAAGLDFACREAAARGLRLSLRQADADALPFADGARPPAGSPAA